MKHVVATFLRGLGVVLPLTLTLWLVYWLTTGAETLLKQVFELFFPERFYLTGLGFLLGIVVIYLVGVLVRVVVVKQLWEWFERLLERIPLVRSIYNGLRDFLGFFSADMESGPSKVVSVDMGGGARLIGFVTASNPRLLGDSSADLIAVYLPMSYQIGGFTVLLPRERTEELDMGVEEAMRFVLTAGIGRDVGKDDQQINP